MKNLTIKRTVAGVMCLSILMQSASYLPANAETASQITINEICAKNSSYPAPDGNIYDWIEFYNNGDTDRNISGWSLSDKESEPRLYVFPEGTIIGANGHLVVTCDKEAAKTDSSAVPFGLSASGETLTLTDADGKTVQTVTFGALAADTSYGQYPDGSGQFYTLSCTPNAKNTAPEGSSAVHQPVFSHDSGFYGSSFELSLSADEGCTVYYTTDGSDPTTESSEYTAPITISDMTETENRLSARTDIVPDGAEKPRGNVDKAAVIRAVAVDKNGVVSDSVTKTFFTGSTDSGYYKKMKVVSLVTDPANLFDNEKGIYCLGNTYEEYRRSGKRGGNSWDITANYKNSGREWERPAIFTLFENGEKKFEQNVGIRIKGAFSRALAQKSFNVYTRKDYGVAEFDYDFFSGTAVKAKNGKAIKKFDGVVLRNGGNDNTSAFFRDSINQTLAADRAFAHQAVSECIVFIDGEFWGIYQMMEKINKSFISDHYGVDKSGIAMIENGELEEGTDSDLSDWDELCEHTANGTVSYEEFCNKVDIQCFIDYFAAQIYWANADWPQNNYSAWRSGIIDESNPYADGKWRMILFDTESGQGLYGSEDKSYSADCFRRIRQSSSRLAKVFTKLLEYEEFRLRFARTMMDLANYNFAPDRTSAVINSYKDNFRQQVADTYARFHSGTLSGDNGIRRFEGEINTVTEFYNKRYQYAERTTRSAAKLSSEPCSLTVVNSADCGNIVLNTLDLGNISSWNGNYHSDYDITIKAAPADGSKFTKWSISGAKIVSGSETSAQVTVRLEGDARIQALYNGQTAAPAVTTSAATKAPAATTTKAAATKAPAATAVPRTTATTASKAPAATKPAAAPAKPVTKKSGIITEAETFDYNSGTDTENCSEGGLDVAYIENDEYIGFKNVDLTNAGKIDFRIGTDGAKASLEIHIDKPDGKLIGKMDIKPSGGWQTWNTQTCNIDKTDGKHDLYFVFRGGEGYLFNVNWWRLDSRTEECIPGDVNSDRYVDVYDLCEMRRIVIDGGAKHFGAADLNGDDAVTAEDLNLLQKFIMGEISSF